MRRKHSIPNLHRRFSTSILRGFCSYKMHCMFVFEIVFVDLRSFWEFHELHEQKRRMRTNQKHDNFCSYEKHSKCPQIYVEEGRIYKGQNFCFKMFQYGLRAEQRGVTHANDRWLAWERSTHFNDIRIKFRTFEPLKKNWIAAKLWKPVAELNCPAPSALLFPGQIQKKSLRTCNFDSNVLSILAK